MNTCVNVSKYNYEHNVSENKNIIEIFIYLMDSRIKHYDIELRHKSNI